MVTDPINVAAHSIFSNKGVFALLLGSGVSRAAEIPTGWEITLDLIRQIAALEKKKVGDRPDEWFIKNKGQQPDYAALLESLPGTADERQAIIRNYIEPSEEDRQEGRKVPTKAHHAIAELIEQGYIRVILTTNFDRLLETALAQRGIEPVVISSDDDVKGAPSITHGRCFVIKVHGDYLDTRIKNTPKELDSYSKEMNKYLDGIFDQFGLIVCGWSGVWDTSLRNAIKRCSSRRYTTFWAARGEFRPEAKELIKKRDAQVIEISDADKFFDDLKEKVRALEDLRRPALSDVRMATAMVKRYLAEDRHRIRLRDTILEQAKITTDALTASTFNPNVSFSPEEAQKRLGFYESETEILRAMLSIGAYWSSESQNDLWPDIIKRLYRNNEPRSGLTVWLDLKHYYPAMLSFYCAGVASVANGNWLLLHKLMTTPIRQIGGAESKTFCEQFHPLQLSGFTDVCKNIEGYERRIFAASEYMMTVVQDSLHEIEPDKNQIAIYFDIFEALLSLAFGYEEFKKGRKIEWFPSGHFAIRFHSDYESTEVKGFLSEADEQQNKWPLIKAGMFGGSYENMRNIRDNFDPFIQKVGNRFW